MSPRPLLILLFVLAGAPALASFWVAGVAPFAWMINLVVLTAAVLDRLLTPSPRHVDVVREVSEVLSVGTVNPVTLRATNHTGVTLSVELTDAPPEPSRCEGLPAQLQVPAGKERQATYRLTPERRGRGQFGPVYLRYPSRLGFWMIQEEKVADLDVRIFPDIQQVSRFDLLARKNRLQEEGLKLWRIRGQGGEFERLREYRREDEPRHIDWKATAKHERLISREFSVNRNQNILFLLDCGRAMGNVSDGITHLDRGLNASIILSYIALGQGDNVALLAFSNRLERAVGPLRGKPAIRRIIREVFDLEPTDEASDYGLAIEEVLRRQRKRALVVLVTHALEEQHLINLQDYIRPLLPTHLLLCVLLRDRDLTALSTQVPDTDLGAFQTAAAGELLSAHARQVHALRDAGLLVIETLPEALSSAVINQYLDLKARHLL